MKIKPISESHMDKPSVSVIVPVYTKPEYFAKLLSLLQQQTLRNMEFIFIDDRHPDGSFALAETAAKDDSRIVLLRNEQNSGPGVSRNKGIAIARGEFIAFADSDDEVPLDFYERLYNKAKETEALIVKGGYLSVWDDGKTEVASLNDRIIEGLSKGSHLVNVFISQHCSAIYNRAHVMRNLARNAESCNDEDTVFIMKVAHNVPREQFVLLPDVFYHYRRRSGTLFAKQPNKTYYTEYLISLKDRVNYVIENGFTDALKEHIANVLDGSLTWRFRRTQHSVMLTKQDKIEYVKEVVEIIRLAKSACPDLTLRYTSRRLLGREITAENYVTESALRFPVKVDDANYVTMEKLSDLTKQAANLDNKINQLHQIICFLLKIKKVQSQYKQLLLKKFFAFGKRRKKLKEKIRQKQTFLKDFELLTQKIQ